MSRTMHLLPVMTAELEVLKATSDRSDPLAEAVLCVVEAAALAVDAAERARAGVDVTEVHSCLAEVLAAARASVTAATFAVVQAKDNAKDGIKDTTANGNGIVLAGVGRRDARP